jgi:ribosomal protein S18 acetylase RimI-like enzyme
MDKVYLFEHLKMRQAERKDLPALEWNGELAHYRRLFEEVFRHTLTGEAIMWLADLSGEKIIGQLFVQVNSQRFELADGLGRAYIYGFRVREAYRNIGVGTWMMEFVEADLKKRGFKTVNLNVGQDNDGALRLYKRLGYEVIGPDPGRWSYMDNHGRLQQVQEPAWRMQKHMNSKI